jgi:N4-gp56 family major capsid protein
MLEPDLQYAQLGTRRDAPKGSDRIVFPQPAQLPVNINVSMLTVGGPNISNAGSVWGQNASIIGGNPNSVAGGFPVSSVVGVAAFAEGSNPTSITWGATSYASGPAQYGILVAVSDLLVRNSAIEVINNATQEVRNALARQVDLAIQAVVNAGSNGVIYSGGRTARTSVGAGDLISTSDIVRGVTYLRGSNAAGLRPFDGGFYTGIIHPNVMGDLMSNTASGSWVDIGRYATVDDLKVGKVGDFRGVRFLQSAFQSYYNSTVPVMPTTLIGQDSFGWGYFQEPQAILTTTPDSTNPLNLYSSIGGKVSLGVTRFNDSYGTARIIRIESAFTA